MQTTLIAVILAGAGTTLPPLPPAPTPESSGGAGTFITTGQGMRLTQPLTRAEWYQLLRGEERMDIEQREKLRLLRRMMEDDDLAIVLLL